MRSCNLLIVLAVLFALAYTISGYDPGILQDFCVAIEDTKSAVYVNGKLCKDPELATADDFFYSGLNIRRNASNHLGINITLLTANAIPGLNTLGLSMGRLDFAPHGLNPPHHHPRASEILLVLEGVLYAGFITSNPDHRFFSKILKPGDIFLFPQGLVHFQLNLGDTRALAIVAFGSQNPGVITEANTLFGSSPPINPEVLTKAFHLDKKLVQQLQNETWENPS